MRIRETEGETVAGKMKEREGGKKLENSMRKRGRELIVAEEKKEVECDGGVCDADSSMSVTLAGEEGEPYRISMFSPPQWR